MEYNLGNIKVNLHFSPGGPHARLERCISGLVPSC